MFFSAWQDVPAGTVVPLHPSKDPRAVADGRSAEALRVYRDILRGLRDLGLPWDEALTGIDIAYPILSNAEAADILGLAGAPSFTLASLCWNGTA